MNRQSLSFAGIAVLVSTFSWGCSGEAPASFSQEAGSELRTRTSPARLATVSGDYKFEPTKDLEVHKVDTTELWARVYAPAELEAGTRYPVLVFLHGYHGTCGDISTVPRTDKGGNYRYHGECDEGQIVVENHAGYGYIAEEMASHGYLVVSVNANRGFSRNDAFERGRLILKHLEKLARWDQGQEPTPAELGFDLQGHVDLGQVGLMGHSQGGRGVMHAYRLEQEDTIDWDERLGTDLTFRSIFEVAPIDAGETLDPVGVPVGVLLPLCDGDIPEVQGVRLFDRSMHPNYEWPGNFRATVTVYGANHNYFNTEWQHADQPSDSCPGQTPLFDAVHYRPPWYGYYTEGVTGSLLQQEIGRKIMSRFFLGTVGADAEISQAAMFDPRNPLPSEMDEFTLERGFSPSTYAYDHIEFEDFQGETGVGPWGDSAWINGISVEYTELPDHEDSYRGALITWEDAHYANVFEPHLTGEGWGINLQSYDTLDFRVEPADDPERNVTDELNFTIRLVDGDGFVSQPVWVKDYVTLSGRERIRSILQTVRIPLSDFNGLSLSEVRGVRFGFEDQDVDSGALFMGSIRATRGGIPAQ